MITFNVSSGLRRESKLNFGLLASIINNVISVSKREVIRVEKSRKSYSYYKHDIRTIGINLNECRSQKAIICTLLHELRHYMQKVEMGNSILFGMYLSYNDYYYSPEEVDARKFEKICGDICKIYNCYKDIEEKLKKHKLKDMKELRKNKAEEKLKL